MVVHGQNVGAMWHKKGDVLTGVASGFTAAKTYSDSLYAIT